MMISEIFIISSRADILIYRAYRPLHNCNTRRLFTKRLKDLRHGSSPPCFEEAGVQFFYIKRSGVFFVATSPHAITPVLVIELLNRVYGFCKDFCGSVNEDSVKANSLLMDEMLGEILDMGFVQIANTAKLKPYIQSEAVVVKPTRSPSEDLAARLLGFENRITAESANRPMVTRPITDQGPTKNEIFVDVIDRITAVIGADGLCNRFEINGTVKMRSFLPGNPCVKIGVNEDLIISPSGSPKGYGNQTQFDQCSFHPSVKLDEFEKSRILQIYPSSGELTLLTYSIRNDVVRGVPFQVQVFLTRIHQSRDSEMVIKVKGNFPPRTQAVKFVLRIPVSKFVTSVCQQLSGPDQTAELILPENLVEWRMKRFTGGHEHMAKFRLICQNGHEPVLKEIGPVSMQFEISGFTSSGFQLRFLRVYDREGTYVAHRWIRYITFTDSYIVKV